MSEKFSIDEVRTMALESGFKLKEQPNGEMDLNPYVFDFGQSLVEESEKRIAELEHALSNPTGLQELICVEQMKDIPLVEIHRANQMLHEKLESAEQRVKELEAEAKGLRSYILNKFPKCPDAPKYLSDYCDMMHVCHTCKARMQAVEKIEQLRAKLGGE